MMLMIQRYKIRRNIPLDFKSISRVASAPSVFLDFNLEKDLTLHGKKVRGTNDKPRDVFSAMVSPKSRI